MKQRDILLLGALGVGALLLSRRQQPEGGGGGLSLDSLLNPGKAISDLVTAPFQNLASGVSDVLTSKGAVTLGGGAAQAVSPLFGGAPEGQSPGSLAALANATYINAVLGREIISSRVVPTAASSVLNLTAAPGVPVAQAQRYINVAISAAAAQTPIYGVTPSSGGATVFNIPTSQPTASAGATGATNATVSRPTTALSSPFIGVNKAPSASLAGLFSPAIGVSKVR